MRWPWHRKEDEQVEEARRATEDAERKLNQARRDWPKVHEAHDRLADLIESALRKQGGPDVHPRH